MPVYQAKKSIVVTWYYDRILLREGQLVALNNPKLVKVLDDNPFMEEVDDDELIRLAPPLHLIKQPEDPYRMRKDDVINELRSYGIQVDPYQMSHTLSIQLQTARAMLKRNFITVLNNRGQPVYIDRARLPVARILSPIDNTLPEPDDAIEDDYEPIDTLSHQEETDSINKRVSAEADRRINHGSIAASIDPDYTEAEIRKGMDYSEWLIRQTELAEKNFRAPVQQTMKGKEINFNDTEELKIEEKIDQPKENYKIKDVKDMVDSIKENPHRNFMINEPSAEVQAEWFKIKLPAINIDVAENILRFNGIQVNYDDTDGKTHRWEILDALKAFIDGSGEERKWHFTVNALQARHDELCHSEPNFRKMTEKGIKRKVTELGKYGLNVSYSKDTKIRTFARKVYQIAKLGLQCPDTEEEIDTVLVKNKRSAFIK